MSAKRPLSPHLQIYSLFTTITSLTSILHRMTGAALVFGSLIIVGWLMGIAHGEESYIRFSAYVRHPLGIFVLIGFTWAFWYQLMNGIRHLFWDAGYGFDQTTVSITGTTVLAGSVLATLATWGYIFYL